MLPKLPVGNPDENIMKMNFDDELFDHIFVYSVFEHPETPNPVILMIKRVCKPGYRYNPVCTQICSIDNQKTDILLSIRREITRAKRKI